MPLVFLDTRADAGGAFVGTDNHVSMGLIVDYLLRSGAPPSYVGMPAVNQNADERCKGYEAAMLKHGVEPVVFDLPDLGWDFERLAFDEATRLFKAGAPVGETILCANDRIAFGVIGLVLLGAVARILLVNDPMGGRPVVEVGRPSGR